ncbi:MAG: Asp-tRNA(Asn)/Glu-tRNA(Gln) amidotransferase subunit GatB [Candidatus Krumholzibacteriota bacterium]|nr:Asp-tRNA(Asn)/Glu-tRNA(Gln) amidotransferase subunit GatB [Candidatus Krumholzibacteriota bacterium]
MSSRYEPVIGLEVHAQLLTKSKIYCGCPVAYGEEPNTLVCPVCLGLPGSLPVLNERAVEMAVKTGLAMGCSIAPESVFSRKNYFYPDAPRNYQISMYDRPLCGEGRLEFEFEGERRVVCIERIHLEDDAGKLVHVEGGGSLVDFNRCGVPLIEIVSGPDMRSPGEAAAYLTMLRRLLRWLGVCDGNMEEGSLRCDVNISIRPEGSTTLGTRTEIKNLNSIKAVEMGIRWEMERQRRVLEGGGEIIQVTNLWDAAKKRLVTMRRKEYAHDYRYFPEPDLLPLTVEAGRVKVIGEKLPELPLDREKRFRDEYGLSAYDVAVLCAERGVSDYFEETAALAGDAKTVSNWIMREVLGEMKNTGGCIEEFPLTPPMLAGLLELVARGAISGSAGTDVFREMIRTGDDAGAVVEQLGLEQISGEEDLARIVDETIAAHPEEAARCREGRTQLIGFFVGQVMKRSRGKANPKLTGEIIRKKLEG